MMLCFLFLLYHFSLPSWADLSIPSNETIFNELKKKLSHQTGDYYERSVKREGELTIALEVVAVADGDFSLAKKIYSDFPNYRNWVLRDINRRPGGGMYYLQMTDLVKDENASDILIGKFLFDLPMFKREMVRHFRTKSVAENDALLITVNSVTSPESIIGIGAGFMKVFPAPSTKHKLWYYLRGTIKLRNWLLYEALPDKILARESGERIQQLLDNYSLQEDRLKDNELKSNQSPTQKTVTQGK